MLCFHGYGMHGRQFKILEQELGNRYTFYGFDLFFHKGTQLYQQDRRTIRQGISKETFCGLIGDFCAAEQISRFSVIAYSMGTHYSSAIVECMANRLDEYIAIAPSSLKPGALLSFLSSNRLGNLIFKKLMLSENGLLRLIRLVRRLGVIDEKSYTILHQEIATPELRFALYACASYMHRLKTDEERFIRALNSSTAASYFIFGRRDHSYPPSAGRKVIRQINAARRMVLDEDHELINRNLGKILSKALE
jgi:pimeloyl-ACP methyl ester carboxylesterase